MNEIFVEEENTVYELDPECLKRKEEQKKKSEGKNDKNTIQKMSKCQDRKMLWLLVFILFIRYQ